MEQKTVWQRTIRIQMYYSIQFLEVLTSAMIGYRCERGKRRRTSSFTFDNGASAENDHINTDTELMWM